MEAQNIRAIVRQIINESFGNLEEMQSGKQFGLYLDYTLENLVPDVPEGQYNDIDIMKEVKKQLQAKLANIFLKQFEYPNFYIIKLGNFILKTNTDTKNLSFKKNGEEYKLFSYPYLYVYHNTAEIIRFGSRFYETDPEILKAANEFIKNKGINLVTKTEQGKIFIISDFDKDNILDQVDWSIVKRPEAPKPNLKAKEKNTYAVGQPLTHPLFGKGRIIKTRNSGELKDGVPLYNVTVDFNGKERVLRVPVKQKSIGLQAAE